jgi:hypothetical protein
MMSGFSFFNIEIEELIQLNILSGSSKVFKEKYLLSLPALIP